MPTYGQRPDDVVQDSRGNALSGVTLKLYATEALALADGTPLGTVLTDESGRWRYATDGELWARLPGGAVWQVATAPVDLIPALEAIAAEASDRTDAVSAEAAARSAADGSEAAARAAAVTRIDWATASLLARTGAFTVTASQGLAAFAASTGLAFTSSYYAASVGGTDGSGIFPIWKNISRVSFRVKITKATGSSKSYVGVCNTVQGVAPTGATPTFGVGYLAGTGLCFLKENVGGPTVLIADASLTDGDEYDVSLTIDQAMLPPSAVTPNNAKLMTRYAKSDGTGANHNATNINLAFWPDLKNWMVRTNVAAGGITNLTAQTPAVAPGAGLVAGGATSYSTTAGEDVFIRIPKNPNGLAVIACHGHGGSYLETGWTSSTYKPSFDALEAAGFAVFIPDMGGDLWGNDTAQSLLATLHGYIVNDFRLDPRVFLWGNSMGGGAALAAIGKGTIPVRAAYLGQPVTDLSAMWANPSFATLPAAYGSDVAARDANNPQAMPASAFAGVPMLFVASASDTTAVKATHTDTFRTKLGAVNDNRLLLATGNHNDLSHFRATDTVAWFSANI